MKFIIHEGMSRDLFPLTGPGMGKIFYQMGGRRSLFEEQLHLGLDLVSAGNIMAVTAGEEGRSSTLKQMKENRAEEASVLEDRKPDGSLRMMMKVYAYCRDVLEAGGEEVMVFSSADYGLFSDERAAAVIRTAAAGAEEGDTVGIRYEWLPFSRNHQVKPVHPCIFVTSMKTLRKNMEEAGEDMAELLAVPYGEMTGRTEVWEKLGARGNAPLVCFPMVFMDPSEMQAAQVNTLEDFYECMKSRGADSRGNVVSGPVTADDCMNSLIIGGSRPAAVRGLHHYIAADMPGALVILPADHSEDAESMAASHAVKSMNMEGIPVSTEWGTDCTLKAGGGWVVRCLVIEPGKEVPRHMHGHMRECINVMSGEGTAFFDSTRRILKKNQCSLVPPGAWHRLVNTGNRDWVIISTMTV